MSLRLHQDKLADHQPEARSPWPLGLTAFLVVFAIVLFAFVAWSTTQRTDLVTEDYYAQELAFQEEIERRQRSSSPDYRPAWNLEGTTLVLRFPTAALPENGEIRLYRPSNAALDQSFDLTVDPAGEQRIDLGHSASGAWWIELRWVVGEDDFALRERFALS